MQGSGNRTRVKLYFFELFIGTAYASRQREGKIFEQSFGKGHYVARSSDIFEAPHYKHVHGLDIKAEIKLASEMKKSFKENEVDRRLKDLGMSR